MLLKAWSNESADKGCQQRSMTYTHTGAHHDRDIQYAVFFSWQLE